MSVRRAEAEEWESLRDLRLAALVDSPDAFGSTLGEEREAAESRWLGWITGEGWSGDVATFVSGDGDGLVGMATGFQPTSEPEVVHLFAMWVRPDQRRRGLGRALVAAVVGWATERPDVDRVVLRVTTSNDEAFRFYRSCGFVETSDPPEPLREGSELSTRTMYRRIEGVIESTGGNGS